MKNENPHIPDHIVDGRNISSLHPLNQPLALTQLQQAHLPALMWLFDTNRYRAQGRSTLLAYVCIQLAMQGETVQLDDVSCGLTSPLGNRGQQHFFALVDRMIFQRFPRHRFNLDHHRRTLTYSGQHPR